MTPPESRAADEAANAAPGAPAATSEAVVDDVTKRQPPTEGIKDDQPAVILHPPEGVEWANRWAELENATAGLHVERNEMQKELARLREHRVEKVLHGALGVQGAAHVEEGSELEELRQKLDEAKRQVEERLAQVIAEQDRSARLAKNLAHKATEMAALSSEKLQLHYQKNSAEAELLPVREARERLEREKAKGERIINELRADVAGLTEEHDRVVRERSDLKRKLAGEIKEVRADAAFHQQVAEEARRAQREMRQRIAAAEQKLLSRIEDFAAERARLESNLRLKDEQLSQANSLVESAQQQLADAIQEKDVQEKAKQAALQDAREQQEHAAVSENQRRQLENEYEEVLQHRIANADDGVVPNGFGSLADLVREAKSARDEAEKERREREQLQRVLQDVEREVRSRYPALISQKEELERLRVVADQLAKQNEELLSHVQRVEVARNGAESRARKAARSESIVEAHAKDLAKQLAVLVHERQKMPSQLPFHLQHQDIGKLEAMETERSAFKNLQDVILQNEDLRKTVAKLQGKAEGALQSELRALQEEQAKQVQEWEEHLAAKAEQMEALVDTIERLSRERDEAQRMLKQLESETSKNPIVIDHQPAAAEVISGEQLAAVREEFAKHLETLRKDNQELRTSDSSTRQELATVRGKLEFEQTRKADLQLSLKEAERQLEERRQQLESWQARVASSEDSQHKMQTSHGQTKAALEQARREQARVEAELRQESSKASSFEQKNAVLLSEKAAHVQHVADLQARLLRESDAYKETKHDLEAAFKREEGLLRAQLQASEERYDVLNNSLKELVAARAALEVTAKQQNGRVLELEQTVTKLEGQLSQHAEERKGAPPAQRGGTEVDLQLPEEGPSAARDLSRLQQKLHFAEEREQEATRSAEVWRSLVATHEVDLQARHDEVARLQSELEALRTKHTAAAEANEVAQQREQALEAQVNDLRRAAAQLQITFDAKDAEVVAAKLAGEEKVQEMRNRCEAAELAVSSAQASVEEWQERHREAISAHSEDITELTELKLKCTILQSDAKELRQQVVDLGGEVERAKTTRLDEITFLRKQLEQSELRAEALGQEMRKYQEHLMTMSQKQGLQEDSSEAVQRIALEMKRAREISEQQRQEVELDRARLEREAKSLRTEVSELQTRLDSEQEKALQLQAEVRREHRATAKLAQVSLIEDENQRLLEEIKRLQDESTKLTEEGKTLRDQNPKLSEEGKALKDENRKLSEEGKAMREETSRLLEEGKTLRGQLDDVRGQMQNQEKQVEPLKRKLGELQQKEKLLERASKEQRTAQQRADKSLGLAIDFQRAVEAVIAQNNELQSTAQAAKKVPPALPKTAPTASVAPITRTLSEASAAGGGISGGAVAAAVPAPATAASPSIAQPAEAHAQAGAAQANTTSVAPSGAAGGMELVDLEEDEGVLDKA